VDALIARVAGCAASLCLRAFRLAIRHRGACRSRSQRCCRGRIRRDGSGDGRLDGRRTIPTTGIVTITTTRLALAAARGGLGLHGGGSRCCGGDLARRRFANRLVPVAFDITIAVAPRAIGVAVTIPRAIRAATIAVAPRAVTIPVTTVTSAPTTP
jgi:hypothetical protein